MRVTFLQYSSSLTILFVVLLLLLNPLFIIKSLAQEMALVYDVENTGADCPIPYLPSFSELPIIKPLPDPFEWADGRGHMKNFSDWRIRRAEIGAQIQNYEVGKKPPRPDSITASYSGGILTVNVTVNNTILTLTSQITLPVGSGPFPAVIGLGGFSGSGSIPSDIFTSRNIATILFNHNQVTTYGSPSKSDPYYRLYPNLNPDNTGQYSAWSWGVSRIIDGLELVQNVLPIDLKHIAVTGCSYAGKMALFAGAFDERIALTIAQESGGGGATSWRYSHSEPAGTVECIDNTDYNWFMNSMKQFSGDNVWRLPEDHHELMAMVAPRALYVTANPDYIWLSNPSSDVCSRAAKEVYKTLGISDRFGFSIAGGHQHCLVPSDQIPEIEAFVDKFLLGKDTVNTDSVSDSPYNIDLSPWITWNNPTLVSGTTFYTTLVYPSNLQASLDTNITFKWKKINEAEKYYIELSTEPSFSNIDKSDSTTDTSKTFTGLLKNQKYYWRVKVKSTSDLGPWSNTSSFVTTVSTPSAPKIVSAVSDKMGYITLNWNKAESADQYLIQVAFDQAFTNIFKSVSTSDTVKSITWFSEGIRYYWRVQANNIAGSGLWSNVGNFTLLYAPTNLDLQISAPNQITLSWKDNSTIKDGYVIERKQSPQTSFAVIDTLKGGGNEYTDNNLDQGQSYTYRLKAYKDSLESDYSNEASLTIVGIKGEKEDTPNEYSISQNYPNPFNPTTKIKFALPKAGLTKLTIYDLLGREVITLINNELKAGYHEINIAAHNLPSGVSAKGGYASGVYFYQLRVGDFIQTKKMILMK